jgi:hypothetical protein
MERRCCCPFIGRRGRGKGAEAVVWELAGVPLMAAAGGSVEGGYGEGKGREAAVVGGVNAAVSSRCSGGGGGARGRPDAGRRRGRPAAGAAREKGLEVGDGPDRWGPLVGGCVREREAERR